MEKMIHAGNHQKSHYLRTLAPLIVSFDCAIRHNGLIRAEQGIAAQMEHVLHASWV